MKKYIPTLIVGMIVLCGLGAAALPFHVADTNIQAWKESPRIATCNSDELDQSQPTMTFFGPVGQFYLASNKNYIMVQSFKPTKNLLTRVELMAGKNSTTTYDFTVAIRDDLNGSDLTSISVPAESFPAENFSWIEFDFNDIMVTPGQNYYIVSSTVNATDNWYAWGLNLSNAYPNGTVYWTINNGANWTNEPTLDMTFKTYGSNATALGVEITGGIGVSVSTKNIGDINANNVTTHLTITGGILGLINISLDDNTSTLIPSDTVITKKLPLGLGPITIIVTARAENAVEVSKNVSALILFFFVILK